MPGVPLEERLAPAAPVIPDRLVRDGDTLDWQRRAALLAVSGHTPESTAVWLERERVLIAGDAVASHNGRPILGVFNADRPSACSTPIHPQRETAFAVSRAWTPTSRASAMATRSRVKPACAWPKSRRRYSHPTKDSPAPANVTVEPPLDDIPRVSFATDPATSVTLLLLDRTRHVSTRRSDRATEPDYRHADPTMNELFATRGFVKIRDAIDGEAFTGALMAQGEGTQRLPVKAALRKTTGEEKGDIVHIRIDERIGLRCRRT